MNQLDALILGIIQGFTEFFPISSSTHLKIIRQLLGISESEAMVFFDLICHLGTILAAFLVLRKDIAKTLLEIRSYPIFFWALTPLIPAYFLLKPIRAALADDPGIFLICTSLLLFLSSRKNVRQSEKLTLIPYNHSIKQIKYLDAFLIGIAQSLALLPGISRSGCTISTARLLGWQWQDAARFSFLLAIPSILGGIGLEMVSSVKMSISLTIYGIGFLSSFVVGIGSIYLLFWIVKRTTLKPFAWYCLVLGLLLIIYRTVQ